MLLTACGNAGQTPREASYSVTEGTQEYRGFTLDNVLHSETEGDIHFNLYVPDSYDGSHPTSIFFTLPGYEGLYFQGTGENLYQEDFGFAAQEYDPDMIVVAPQLSGWGEESADQTIALVEYFLPATISTRRESTGKDTPGAGRPCPLSLAKYRSFLPPAFCAVPGGTGPMSR